MKRQLWICFAAALAAAAALAPRPARGDSPAAAATIQACLGEFSFCVNLPPPTEQCCGGLVCNGAPGRGGQCVLD
jgi:hypothetical protein